MTRVSERSEKKMFLFGGVLHFTSQSCLPASIKRNAFTQHDPATTVFSFREVLKETDPQKLIFAADVSLKQRSASILSDGWVEWEMDKLIGAGLSFKGPMYSVSSAEIGSPCCSCMTKIA